MELLCRLLPEVELPWRLVLGVVEPELPPYEKSLNILVANQGLPMSYKKTLDVLKRVMLRQLLLSGGIG